MAETSWLGSRVARDKPMTNAERQARWRKKHAAKLALGWRNGTHDAFSCNLRTAGDARDETCDPCQATAASGLIMRATFFQFGGVVVDRTCGRLRTR
jgi:hypothetical protein